jgi:hypothetical protein
VTSIHGPAEQPPRLDPPLSAVAGTGADANTATPSCANCDTALVGAYCHACGQSAAVNADFTVRRFLATGAHEVSDLDSVLLRTLRTLMLRPGQLTVDYLAGRRARHYSPFKLYLLVSALYLLLGWEAYNEMQGMSASLRQDPAFEWLRGDARTDGPFVAEWIERTAEFMAYARFVSVAGVALVVGWLFRRPKRPYAAHLIFALHYYAFDFAVYSALLVPILLTRWLTGQWPPAWLIYVPLPAYVWYAYVAARRVYAQSRAQASLKAVGLFVGDIFLSAIGTVAALAAARVSMR